MKAICVIGHPEDLCATYVTWLARRRGLEVLELPEEGLGVGWSFDLEESGDPIEAEHAPSAIIGELCVNGATKAGPDLAGAFVRLFHEPPVDSALSDLGEEEKALFVVERRAGMHRLLECWPGAGPVVNRPSAGRSNASKAHQMRLLESDGFEVPRWMATSDPGEAAAFTADCAHGAVYKSVSGLRSRVRRVGGDDGDVVTRLSAGGTPVIVQEYVPGRDVRLHIVTRLGAPAIFPTGVASSGTDYRFESGDKEFYPVEAPPNIVARCLRAAAREGLLLAGFDFRVTPAGGWLCLEVNPVPTFITYEAATGQPIGDAIVDALAI